MTLNLTAIFFVLISISNIAFSASPLCSYQARISDIDKKNSSGTTLLSKDARSSVIAVIRQDRANFHHFNIRDTEDSADCLFSTKENREKLEKMIEFSKIDKSLVFQIIDKNPLIQVDVFPDKIEISLATSSQEKKSSVVEISKKEPSANPTPNKSPSAEPTTKESPTKAKTANEFNDADISNIGKTKVAPSTKNHKDSANSLPQTNSQLNGTDKKSSKSALTVILKSVSDESEGCRLNFSISNRLGFNLSANSLVGGIITRQGRKFNMVDSNIGPRPSTIASLSKGIDNGKDIEVSRKINGLKCVDLKTISGFGIFDETAAIKDGLTELTMIYLDSDVAGVWYTWNPDSYGARYRESEAAKARVYRIKEKMTYVLAFVCIDPYGGTNNDIELAKTLLIQLSQDQFQAYASMITSSQVSRFCSTADNRPIADIEALKNNYNESIGNFNGRDYFWSRPNSNTTWGVIGK
jgi:hypothetical protein